LLSFPHLTDNSIVKSLIFHKAIPIQHCPCAIFMTISHALAIKSPKNFKKGNKISTITIAIMISIRSIRWRKKLVAKNETHRESCCINPLHFNLTLELLSLCLCKIWLFQQTPKKKKNFLVGIFNNSTYVVYFKTFQQLIIKIFDYVNMVVVSSKWWLGSFQEFLAINFLVFPFLKIVSQKHLGVFFPLKTNSKWHLYFGRWNVTNVLILCVV
jgi:hypothetical protein